MNPPSLSVTFLYPIAGWLLVLLPLVWCMARPPRLTVGTILRMVVVSTVVLAIMQPSMIHRSSRTVRVYLVDQRPQLAPAIRLRARIALSRILDATNGGRRVLVQLGGKPIAARVDARSMVSGASLSVALAKALDELPLDAGGTITVIADPRSTDTHWEDAVGALVRRGIRVDTVALPTVPAPAFIDDVRFGAARIGETVQATVEIEGDGREHVVTLSSGSRRLASSTIPGAIGPSRIALRFPTDRAGFLPIRAELDARVGIDTIAAIQDPLRLLYLGHRQIGAAPKLQRLLGRGFSVEQRPVRGLARAFDPAHYPLVLLDDVPADAWSPTDQKRLMDAIARRGVGLIATGGRAAFGMGGYVTAPLAAALPVTPRQDDKSERPSVALAIVIDSSGSMQGEPLDLAKQVARQTVRKLTPADWVGVVEFYGAKQWAVPVQPARDTDEVERAIGRMEAQGASMLFPALQEAYYGLKDVNARYKHILIISDGGVVEDRYQQLLRHIADDRINVSTAVVGRDTSGEDSMAAWARTGRGRFYSVPDEFGLVAIDFHQPQSRPQPGYRNGESPLAGMADTGWWPDSAGRGIPAIDGYARVRTRPAAQTLLATRTGDPLLASWQFGSGRVTALATEPLGEGSRRWRDWPGYGAWLARIAAMTARERPSFDVAITRRFDRVAVAAQRLDGTVGPAPIIRMVDDGGRNIGLLPTEQRAPGLFVGDVRWPAAKPALVELRDGDVVARSADRAFSDVSQPDAMPSRRSLPLARLAALTGGSYRDDASATPSAYPRGGAPVATDVWPLLALVALVLYLIEIVHRRRPRRTVAWSVVSR